jgi:2-methylcitrate dehydratase PrpD
MDAPSEAAHAEASARPLTAAEELAEYAASLRYHAIPEDVRALARACLIDTVAASIAGAAAPASQIVLSIATGAGPCRIIGANGPPVRAESAALANGVAAHALELDSLRQPSAGVHPGAVLVPAALAAAQERGCGGEALLAGIVAGCEVLCRVGRATRHSAEARGFHAPGLTGPFGAAIAAGCIFGLDRVAMTNALGIAGSLAGGLLAFAAAGEGAMVKRLHLGRAAEAGIIAARLAEHGFTGPRTVLEGRFGFLETFCAASDPAALTAGLGATWETRTLCFKRYPCHISAHTPVRAIELLRGEHAFDAADMSEVTIEGNAKMASLHAGQEPADTVMAQYSIPFAVAVALLRDPREPENFSAAALADPRLRALARRVRVVDAGTGSETTTRLAFADGRTLALAVADFPGTPASPLTQAELAEKFTILTRRLGPAAPPLLARLSRIEEETALDWLGGFAA